MKDKNMQNQVPEKVLEEKIRKIVNSTFNLKKEAQF